MKMPFINDKPIRLIELFGGIGSQAMALSKLGVNFEHYRLVEFDTCGKLQRYSWYEFYSYGYY